MAKAELKLPNGTHVQIEGNAEEVASLLAIYSSESSSKKQSLHPKRSVGSKRKIARKGGPIGLIKELLEEGYFKGKKRRLPEIQKKLEERGNIYAQSSLSPALIRLAKSRQLRRIKEKKGWVYVV